MPFAPHTVLPHHCGPFVFLPGTRFGPGENGTRENDRIPDPVQTHPIDFTRGSFWI